MARTARLHQDVPALEWLGWIGNDVGAGDHRSGAGESGCEPAALVGAGHLDARLEGADFLRP
jgi:hypothetical protein